MSNDIFYTNISNLVTFYMGERPSADKFNAVNKYFSRGMRELATAIGDINDDGFPYIGEGKGLGPSWNAYDGGNVSRPLDIVSLARLIGPASNLNARMHLTKSLENELIQEFIVDGSLHFKLLYPATGVFIIPGFSPVAEEEAFTSSDQYKLISRREVLFASALTGGVTASYTTDPSQYYGGVDYQDAGFNVIPDPNQNLGVTIELISDRKYKITFPKITAQQSGLSLLESSLINTEAEFNNNRYYELPKWLVDSILDSNGNVIEENRVVPGNFLYLKNRETKEVYKDAVYEYESSKELIVSNIDLCEEESGSYSDTKYCVILTGANITNTLDDLRLKWFKHSHDGRFGESPISFKSLVGKYEGAPPSGAYGPSSNDWNQMPMYLHRDGYSADSNENNGDNAMRGNLALGLENFNPLNTSESIMDDLGTSHKILFGGLSTYMGRLNSGLWIVNDTGGISIHSSEQMHLKASYSLLVETVGLLDQALVLRNNNDSIVLESDKNVKITDLNSKEYLNVNAVEKSVTVNEGFVFEEFTPSDILGDYHPSDLNNKRHLNKKGTKVSKISNVRATLQIDPLYTDSLKLDVNGNLITGSIFNVMQNSEALWGEKIYLLDESEEGATSNKWSWNSYYLSNNTAHTHIIGGNVFMTDVYRESRAIGGFPVPEHIRDFLILSDLRSMNNSYEIDLFTSLESLKDDGSGQFIPNGTVPAIHLPEAGGPEYISGGGVVDIYDSKYSLLELNRGKTYEMFHKNSNEEIENNFYFRVNLPRAYNAASLNKDYFPRFIIRFEYSGKLDGNEYISNNPCISPGEDALFISGGITEVNKVTLNGRILDETSTAPMLNFIAGESDSYESAWIQVGGRSKVGFNEGIKAYDPNYSGGPMAYSENIRNEYAAGAFSSNQFKANTWYKVKERIFKNKVWLEITG